MNYSIDEARVLLARHFPKAPPLNSALVARPSTHDFGGHSPLHAGRLLVSEQTGKDVSARQAAKPTECLGKTTLFPIYAFPFSSVCCIFIFI
jgi:hypothetical protein